MPSCPLLQTVNLARNELGAEGGKAIAEAMPKCAQLQTVHLHDDLLCADGRKAC